MYCDMGRAEIEGTEGVDAELLDRFRLSAGVYRRCVETALWTSPEAQGAKSIEGGLRRARKLAQKSYREMVEGDHD